MLSEELLEAAPQVLESERAEKGLGYMRGLVELLRQEGQSSAFILGDGVTAEVWGWPRTASDAAVSDEESQGET